MRYAQMMRRLRGRKTLHGEPTEVALRAVVAEIFADQPHLRHALELRWRLHIPVDKNSIPVSHENISRQLERYYPGTTIAHRASWTTLADRKIKRALAQPSPLRKLFQWKRNLN